MNRNCSLFLTMIMLAGCTQHPKVGGMTPPATVIDTKNLTKVTGKLAEICNRVGLTIDETTSNSVTCSKEADTVAQVFMYSKGGSTVQAKVRMNVFPINDQIKVVANGWYESQNAFGKVDRNPATNSDAYAQMQNMLDQAKLELDGKGRK